MKLFAEKIGVTRIHATEQQARIEFKADANINPRVLIQLIQVHAKRYQLDGPTKLRATLTGETGEARITEIQALLKQLAEQ